MVVLITGCFDNSDRAFVDLCKSIGVYTFDDGVDPRLDNDENVMARLHSNMLINENNGSWIVLKRLKSFLKNGPTIISNNRMRLWEQRAVNLMTDMDSRADGDNWLWKDTRLAITIQAWHTAVQKLSPDRDVRYIVCYQHPESFMTTVQKLSTSEFGGFKKALSWSRADFYEMYYLYFENILDWLDVSDAVVRGYQVDPPEFITSAPADDLYNRLRRRLNG